MFCVFLGSCASAFAGVISNNLVTNGSFEDYVQLNPLDVISRPGFAELETGGFVDILGWEEEGAMSLGLYGGTFSHRNPPAGGGDWLLFGDDPQTAVTQTIDLGFANSLITSGMSAFELSAYLGSFEFAGGIGPQDDFAVLRLGFHDSFGTLLEQFELTGPKDPSDAGLDNSVAGNFLGFVQASGLVPVGASNAIIRIDFHRDFGFNNASADLVDFRISAVPEPTSLAIFGIGMLGLIGLGRRKQKQSA